jgi:uncharacterized protein YeaO (DUF488 family)
MITIKIFMNLLTTMRVYTLCVDRFWPRGVSKDKALFDNWFKGIAPSTELLKWFNHEPEKWSDFKKEIKSS